jgi:hypothetical protein
MREPVNPGANPYLLAGALLSATAAALHLAVIVFGAPWYRFFGAGEQMARLAEAGSIYPALVTLAIAAMLVVWSLYALSGAGLIAPLPLLRPALCAITAVYLMRGLVIVPLAWFASASITRFWIWSSAICLVYGIVHLVGLVQTWARL